MRIVGKIVFNTDNATRYQYSSTGNWVPLDETGAPVITPVEGGGGGGGGGE